MSQPEHVLLLTDGVPTSADLCSKVERTRETLGADGRLTILLIGDVPSDSYECFLDEENENVKIMYWLELEPECSGCPSNIFVF